MTFERYLHGLWSAGWLDRFAASTAEYGLYACAAVLLAAWLRRRPSGMLLPFAIAAIVAVALDGIAGFAYQDQRPFVVLGVAPLVAHGVDNGFPSEHSAAAAFIGVATLFIDVPLGAVACVIALAIGIARLYCLLHSPADVIAGWSIGAAPAVIAAYWWRKRRWPSFARPTTSRRRRT